MRRLFLCLLLTLLAPTAYAYQVDELSLWIGEDGFVWVKQKVSVDSEGEIATVRVPDFAQDITASDSEGVLPVNTTEADRQVFARVYLRDYLEEGQSQTLWLEFGTQRITKKEDGLWSIAYFGESTPRKTIVKVTYPVGAQVVSLKPEDLLRTYVTDGVWLYPQESSFNFTSTYRYGGVIPQATTTTVAGGGQSLISFDRTLVYVLLGFSLVVAAAALYMYLRSRKPRQSMTVNVGDDLVSEPKVMNGSVSYDIGGSNTPKGAKGGIKESVANVLDESEMKVIRLLENSEEDEITQAYIYKSTGIPKSSLSDILKRLEKRNIIERRVAGRVKWIKIKTWVLE